MYNGVHGVPRSGAGCPYVRWMQRAGDVGGTPDFGSLLSLVWRDTEARQGLADRLTWLVAGLSPMEQQFIYPYSSVL